MAGAARPDIVHSGHTNEPLRWHDAAAAAHSDDNTYIITSPNMNHVPEPFIGLVQVRLREDCRYGPHDPLHWPQVYSEEFGFLCAIRRPAPGNDVTDPLWRTPDASADFVLVEGAVFKCLGLLSSAWIAPLTFVVDNIAGEIEVFQKAHGHTPSLHRLRLLMCQTHDRLLHFPSTFRDASVQLRGAQHYCIMARAFMEYSRRLSIAELGPYESSNSAFMGAFTTDPIVVQRLLRAGIPVWFIRPDIAVLDTGVVRLLTVLERAESIPSADWQHGAPPIYSGLVGEAHLAAICRRALTYADISRAPLLVRYDAEMYCIDTNSNKERTGNTTVALGHSASSPARNPRGASGPVRNTKRGRARGIDQPHPSHVRGRDKFVDVQHEWMPATLPAWQLAMTSVDRASPAKRGGAIWGYWLPEPGLLLGPRTQDRIVKYITNWLRLRPAWLYVLSLPETTVTKLGPQWWRDYLNGDVAAADQAADTRRAFRLQQVRTVFAAAFSMSDYVGDTQRLIPWLGSFLDALTPALCRQVIWEVFELGFRYELLTLDRILVPARHDPDADVAREELLSGVFHDHDLYALRRLPDTPAGLATTLPHRRVRCLEAFRKVLSRWPLCPKPIYDIEAITLTWPATRIEEVERQMTAFYVQTFFDYSGRAPLVPHQFPF